LIAILDAGHAGFLRSANALIQMIGRVARNINGKAIMYADTTTPAMKHAIDETNARRKRQIAYNKENHISPVSSARKLSSDVAGEEETFSHTEDFCESLEELCDLITEKEQQLLAAADKRDTRRIEAIRTQLDGLYRQFIYV